MFVVAAKSEIGGKLCKRVEEIVEENRSKGKKTSIAVSGSSQPALLSPFFMKAKIDWSFVDFFFSDERCVSLDDPDSNFGAWNRLFFVEKGIQRNSIHSIDPSCASAQAMADHYEGELQGLPHEDGYAVFDIIILGMGPDGHTCSLFPDHKEIEVTSQNVTYILDSPKPPKERITLTLPVLNHANHVFFLATGKDKAPMIKSIREKTSAVPSALVQPYRGELIWFIDDQAVSEYTLC